MNLADLKEAVILIGLIALIGSAIAISLDAFKTDIENDISGTSLTDSEEVTLSTAKQEVTVTSTGIGIVSIESAYVNHTEDGDLVLLTKDKAYNITDDRIYMMVSNYSGNTSYWNYSFKGGSYAYNITIDGEGGVNNTTNFLDTIGTILGVSVLIGLVVLAFTFGKRT